MIFAVFNNQSEYDTWHTDQKNAQGLTDSNSPYAFTLSHLFDPVSNPQILAKIDNKIDTSGLTVWTDVQAFLSGFLSGESFITKRIQKRKVFWESFVVNYSTQNNLMGITIEQTNHIVNRLLNIIVMGMTGALETVVSELQNLAPDDFTQSYHWITQQQIDDCIIKVQTYLDEEVWG